MAAEVLKLDIPPPPPPPPPPHHARPRILAAMRLLNPRIETVSQFAVYPLQLIKNSIRTNKLSRNKLQVWGNSYNCVF